MIIEISWNSDGKILERDIHHLYISMSFKIFNKLFRTDCFHLYQFISKQSKPIMVHDELYSQVQKLTKALYYVLICLIAFVCTRC